MIELAAIRKRYAMGDDEVLALDGVDLEIGRNEYVALTGPSGSGKSTLMNLIGCLDCPTSGSYRLNGQDTAGMNDYPWPGTSAKSATPAEKSPKRKGRKAK